MAIRDMVAQFTRIGGSGKPRAWPLMMIAELGGMRLARQPRSKNTVPGLQEGGGRDWKAVAAIREVNMKTAMRAEDIRKVQDAVPFRRFSLVLADGRAFPVPDPDFLSVSPKGTALSLWDKDGSIGSYLDTALVAGIRLDTNGTKHSKRRRG